MLAEFATFLPQRYFLNYSIHFLQSHDVFVFVFYINIYQRHIM